MGASNGDPASGAWHLDKRVPLALIVAIMVQTLSFGVWSGVQSNRLSNVEARQNQMMQQLIDERVDARLAVVENRTGAIDDRLARMELRLDQIVDLMANRVDVTGGGPR